MNRGPIRRRSFLAAAAAVAASTLAGCRMAPPPLGEPETVYARCNLMVIQGDQITWENWQATPAKVPVGTPLELRRHGQTSLWQLTDTTTGRVYRLDTGSSDPVMVEKFVAREPVDLSRFDEETVQNIKNGAVRSGMSKEAVYAALGPPPAADGVHANELSLEQILATQEWVFNRARFQKRIGVRFDASTETVAYTEGLIR